MIKVTNFDAIKLGGRCEIRTHGPFLIDDFQGRCIRPLCQSSVLWWNVLDSNQLTHYRSRFYRPLQSPMLLTFHRGLRKRIRTFDPLIPNQVLCQTELLGESFQIQHKIIIHHITSYVKFYLLHFAWCPKPDSNRHDRSRGVLSPLRLPISPFGQRVYFKNVLFCSIKSSSNLIHKSSISIYCCRFIFVSLST